VADDRTRSWFLPAPTENDQRTEIDTGVPHIARIYNYWLGGKDNFAADRVAAELVIESYPDIRPGVRAQREFLVRAVRYLAEAGIRQFLDIGTGLPSANNTHEVAQAVAPESRVVYVDNDPIVLAHARALLASSPQGMTAYLDADLRDAGEILRAATRMLDLGEPVAVMLIGVLQCIPDSDDPAAIVRRLLDAVPPGSYLVIAHPASDIQAARMETAVTRMNTMMAQPVTLRPYAEVVRFFEGLKPVEPGLVQLHRWRAVPPDPGMELASYGGVAQKPLPGGIEQSARNRRQVQAIPGSGASSARTVPSIRP
jgi:SAM-dependent methyltransferase